MPSAAARLSALAAQFLPSTFASKASDDLNYNTHQLSPTFFLPRAAAIEPDVSCSSFPRVATTTESYR